MPDRKKIEENRFINMDTVRLESQRKTMEEIKKQDHCPFCIENLAIYHKNPILKEGKFWLLTENQWPYANIKQQPLTQLSKKKKGVKNILNVRKQKEKIFFFFFFFFFFFPGAADV